MTVGELIEKLGEFNPGSLVVVSNGRRFDVPKPRTLGEFWDESGTHWWEAIQL